MSPLTKLQDDIEQYKHDKALATKLTLLELNPDFKQLITEGFVQNLSANIVRKLALADEDERKMSLDILTGISAFSNYLTKIREAGELSEERLKATEDELTALRGELT